MWLIVFDVVTRGLRIIFKREWDIRFKETRGEWMDKPTNGRDFYLMESPSNQKMRALLLTTTTNGDTKEWDLSMLFYDILFSDSIGRGISAGVRKAVDDLRKLRNELAHNVQLHVSDADFYSFCITVHGAFQSLGLSLIGEEVYFASAREEEFLAGKSCLSLLEPFHSGSHAIWRANELF